jgi:Zn-dependent protease with chaperone function
MTRSARGVVLLVLLFVLLGLVARDRPLAATLEEFDRRILAELRDQNQTAAALFEQANAARSAGRHREAADLYAQVHALVPRFHHALRRQCAEEMELGNRPAALPLCRQALGIDDSPENQAALALALIRKPGDSAPTEAETTEAMNLASRASNARPDDAFAQLAFCETAIATNDLPALKAGVLRLQSIAPDEVGTHYFLFIVAAGEGRFEAAEDELRRARDRGLPEDVYRRLLASLQSSRPRMPRLERIAGTTGVIWLGVMAVLFLVGLGLSRLALRAAARPAAAVHGRAGGFDLVVRRAYAATLWLCCAYYYASIPILLAAVVLAAAGVIYFFLFIGRLPLALVVSVLGLTGASLWAIVRSLVVRARDEEPGDRLAIEEHPDFSAVLRDVAARLETPSIEAVYLTPGTELAVTERGGWARQLSGRSERCLILGIGVLEGMNRGAFRAVLAHEYGHLSNRDTAGGRLALGVRQSLTVMAIHLSTGRAARWYNPAWLFVQGFHRVFLRLSQGATRLQEVLADRWAAAIYGADAFEEGLRHVIAQQVRFGAHADASVKEAVDRKSALENIYTCRPAAPPDAKAIDAAIAAALAAAPSPYQSHPTPSERFAYVRGVPADQVVRQADGRRDVWSLFRDRERLEREMTTRIRAIVLERYGVSIAAGRTGPPPASPAS